MEFKSKLFFPITIFQIKVAMYKSKQTFLHTLNLKNVYGHLQYILKL